MNSVPSLRRSEARTSYKLNALGVAVIAWMTTPLHAQVVFQESDFGPGSFTLQTLAGGGATASTSVVSVAATGNPSGSLRVQHTLQGGPPSEGFCAIWRWTFVIMSQATFVPSTTNGILSLDFQLDSAFDFSSPDQFLPQSQTAVVRQNGKLYIASRPPGAVGGSGEWIRTSMTGLVASEFAEVVNLLPCTFVDANSHPDFSISGSSMSFGFARGNSTSVGGNPLSAAISHFADNWRMVVNSIPCDSIDFNNDGGLFDPTDIEAFLSVFSEGPCIPTSATCNDIDFNNDGALFDPCDIDSFLLVFSEGPCTSCGQ